MANYINGYSTPRFIIYDTNNVHQDTIDLDLCGPDGLMENYEFYSTKHKLLNYQENIKWYGFHMIFNLNYSEYSPKTNSLKIMKLINYIMNNSKIKIIPRVDILRRQYEVNYTGDVIELGIMKNGINALGNRGITISFRTKYLQTQLQWYDPNDIYTPLEDFVVI